MPKAKAREVTLDIVADPGADSFSDPISPRFKNPSGFMNISVLGLDDNGGTVTLQRSDDLGVTWKDTGDSWAADIETSLTDKTSKTQYRIGIKNGDYVGQPINLKLYTEGSA